MSLDDVLFWNPVGALWGLSETQNVFIFAGQSNIIVSGAEDPPPELETPDDKVKIWNIQEQAWETYVAGTNSQTLDETASFGPEGEFARLWRIANPSKVCYLIKYGVGGTNLASDWDPQGSENTYEGATAEVVAALAALTTPEVQGVFWMQGETDGANETNADAYEANLTAFIPAAREDWSAEGKPFVFGQISDKDAVSIPFAATIRSAQVAVGGSVSQALIVFNDGLSMQGDDLHYDEEGVTDLGANFYARFVGTYSALPSAFGVSDWALTPGDTFLTVGISSLPDNGGSNITDIEYRVDGGSWVSSGGITSFNIGSLTNDTEYEIEIRAVNMAGVSGGSDLKVETPVGAATNFPVIESYVDSYSVFSGAERPITLPSGVQNGDLLVCIFAHDTNIQDIDEVDGDWTQVFLDEVGIMGIGVYTKIATGSDALTIVMGGDDPQWLSLARTFRISGADSVSVSSTISSSADVPGVTASWGSGDNLFMVVDWVVGDPRGISAPPTNYSNMILYEEDPNWELATATRELASASDDPGAFTDLATGGQRGTISLVIGSA